MISALQIVGFITSNNKCTHFKKSILGKIVCLERVLELLTSVQTALEVGQFITSCSTDIKGFPRDRSCGGRLI